jgi:hypothetical protein
MSAFRVVAIELYERDVKLRLPFRFGVVTLTQAPQAFVRARIALSDGREGWGAAAEMLAPKWFDKNLALTNEDNFDQLRAALQIARELYLGDKGVRTAYGHFAAHYAAQIAEGAKRDLNPLVACFGPALIDRAVLDALCRLQGVSFDGALRANLPGIAAEALAPELKGFDVVAWLQARPAPKEIAARHTVGLVDPIVAADQKPEARVNDGLPETLEEVVSTYGHTWFKLKVGGNVAADIDRLSAIASVLDRGAPYRSSLDGNEQYDDADAVTELWRKMGETPRLKRLVEGIVFIEQPINRKSALARDLGVLKSAKPVIIDESDGDMAAFVRAKGLGYAGVSSKTCKGIYRSVLNAMRCAVWNRASGRDAYFMSGEDLTTQAGLSVQQDIALVSALGLTHVERNGHHYVNGMADLPSHEQDAFLKAHPDLYHRSHGAVRLNIVGGQLKIGSFAKPGFGASAEPDWSAMRRMAAPSVMSAEGQSR